MQKILLLIASLFYFNFILAENEIKSWQGIHETPLSRLEQQFAEPPVEFANHVIWGWEGKMDKKTICNDLDSIKKKGFRAVIFEAGYKHLSNIFPKNGLKRFVPEYLKPKSEA